MKHHEQALLLLKKASEDEALLDEILDSERISDEIIGFHAQQAVEKLLKEVLSEFRVAYRKIHDLEKLLNLLADNEIKVPDDIKELDVLSPYAVEFRYDILPEERESPFDRKSARDLVRKARTWAEEKIKP
ncbi:MAG: HEPN domain-containing protein [Methanophagales archaeon]|nr:HEPN domain-containing protein [Methanophagales archaeon]